jgi:hypothetical protein
MQQVCEVLPQDVKTRREQVGEKAQIGYQWVAGSIRTGDELKLYMARLTLQGWRVVRETYRRVDDHGEELMYAEFCFFEDEAERMAKALAANIYRDVLARLQQQASFRK